ncbi:DUF3500 domain-containing protein [Paenibacillus nasutitermitis]|uniref:DUF3500 domain-containing protein n=1 Tax=Paenibacillus nasutitermitis TaxID=1652958 RepID=A0A916YV00_9BACL|nr:DUF3500 domain-containing protein [Paenibacillus nasutitermitis]GGD63150.1 hypothetical protein GCM10010911_21170 [Paenibacillus nasutitermitis]
MRTHKSMPLQSSQNEYGGGNGAASQLLVSRANHFISTLSPLEQDLLMYEFNAADMAVWSNLPLRDAARHGLKFGDLNAGSLAAAKKLAEAALSAEGYEMMLSIIEADEYLRQDAGGMQWGSELYFIAIYGQPSKNKPWMLQITGHHLALNMVCNGERTSATPMFVGVEPQTFTVDGLEYAPMEGRITAIQAMLHDLNESQLAAARLEGEPGDITLGPGRDGDFPSKPQGLSVSLLGPDQKQQVVQVIASWVKSASNPSALELLDAYLSDVALDQTCIGWKGSTDIKHSCSYIRIVGPRLWIEFAGLRGAAYHDQIQIHTIWRDKTADYGGCFERA